MYNNIFLYNDESEIDLTNLEMDNSIILMNFSFLILIYLNL